MEFLKRLRRLAKANCCDRVYAEKVQKYKSGVCGNLPYLEQSFGCNASTGEPLEKERPAVEHRPSVKLQL
jgi:hypothetical protein